MKHMKRHAAGHAAGMPKMQQHPEHQMQVLGPALAGAADDMTNTDKNRAAPSGAKSNAVRQGISDYRKGGRRG